MIEFDQRDEHRTEQKQRCAAGVYRAGPGDVNKAANGWPANDGRLGAGGIGG